MTKHFDLFSLSSFLLWFPGTILAFKCLDAVRYDITLQKNHNNMCIYSSYPCPVFKMARHEYVMLQFSNRDISKLSGNYKNVTLGYEQKPLSGF